MLFLSLSFDRNKWARLTVKLPRIARGTLTKSKRGTRCPRWSLTLNLRRSPHIKFSTSTEQKTKAERKCPHIISDVKIRIEMKHVMHKSSCKIRFFSASPCPSSLSATCFNIHRSEDGDEARQTQKDIWHST